VSTKIPRRDKNEHILRRQRKDKRTAERDAEREMVSDSDRLHFEHNTYFRDKRIGDK
jgi:hypothetical protein